MYKLDNYIVGNLYNYQIIYGAMMLGMTTKARNIEKLLIWFFFMIFNNTSSQILGQYVGSYFDLVFIFFYYP